MGYRAIVVFSASVLTCLLFFAGCDRPGRTVTPSSPQPATTDEQRLAEKRTTSDDVSRVQETPAGPAGSSAEKTGMVPRIIKAKLMPANPRKGDELRVEAAADGNADSITYQWSVNGSPEYGERGPSLKAPLVKGDSVAVVITPERGNVQGPPVTQSAIVKNSPPVVRNEFADVQVSGKTYRARVQAEDADGDKLTYGLLKGPKDMQLDPATGVITWTFQQADAGTHALSISVRDSDKAEVVLDISITIGFGR